MLEGGYQFRSSSFLGVSLRLQVTMFKIVTLVVLVQNTTAIAILTYPVYRVVMSHD